MNIYEQARYIETHVHDAKHIHYYTRTMGEVPKAYSHADEKHHHICARCPDKAEAERLANAVEMRKWIESMQSGVTEYIKRRISHTVCNDCATKLKET